MTEAPFLNRDDAFAVTDEAMRVLSEMFPSLAEDVIAYASELPTEDESNADDDVRLIADNQILLVLLTALVKALGAIQQAAADAPPVTGESGVILPEGTA